MKRIVLLFASLLTMSACSSNQDSLAGIKSYRIDDPITSSYRMVEDNGNLLASGLTDSDKVTKYKDAQFHRRHSPTSFATDDMDGYLPYYVLKSYEEMQEFSHALNPDKHLYSDYFATLKETDFSNHYLIVTHDIALTSGSNSYRFKDLYLKDNVLYAYSMLYDVDDNPGVVGTADMVWTGLSFMIEKDVEYTSFRMISDHYRAEYY